MLDLQSGGLETKLQLKGHSLNPSTIEHGFHQLISEPTHLLPQTSPCIDLIFIDQPGVLGRSYLMMFSVIFPIHLNFPVRLGEF